MKVFLFIFFFSFINIGNTQKVELIKKLPDSLNEISGLTFLNDSTLVAHNDSGSEPILYFLSLKGELVHQVEIEDAKNVDWEAIASDGNFLYIGDIGNNNNKRKNLAIYKVSTKDILKQKSVKSEKILINYRDQKAFPPADSSLNFDAEAIVYYQDSLHVFTKCRNKPFDGNSYQYTVSTQPGEYTLTKKNFVFIGKNGFYKDAVTDVTVHKDIFWFLTYNRIIGYKLVSNKFEYVQTISLKPYTQKEGLVTNDNQIFYISDEKQRILGGGKLYKLKINEN